MSGTTPSPLTPQGRVVSIGIPDSQDYPRFVFTAPYFEQVPLAELIEPSVIEAVEAALPSLVPPYVQDAANTAVQQLAVLLTGSTMSGPLFLNPTIPTQPSQAASMQYVDLMLATAGIPEVPPVPSGQVWARETGQWVPISQTEGTFLPISGGTMTGNIAMSGNTINGLAAVPTLPNGAAPAQWVLNQIASVSLYQGTWNADTNVPDLTQLQYRVNGYTWIAITTSVSGVVVGQAIPGLQGVTVYNGDTIIYSTVQGEFTAIHAGGLTLPEADARYVQLAGSQMSGALLLNANASDPLQAVTLQQMQAAVAGAGIGEAPNTGQLYGRNGLTTSWAPVLPLAGGILTGALTLSGNATQALQAVPFQQLNSAISGAVAGYVPLAGATMSGLLTLSGNAANPLNPVPLQQINSMLGAYLPLSGGTVTGALTVQGTFLNSPAGRIISSGSGNNPSVTAWDVAANTAVGFWCSAGEMSIGSMTGAGVPQSQWAIITPAGNITLPGNLTANGSLTGTTGAFSGNLVAGTLGSNGTLTVTGATQLNNTLGVSGNTTISAALTVTGAASAASLTGNSIVLAGGWVGNLNGIDYTHIGGANAIGFIFQSPNLYYAADGVGQGGLQPLTSDAGLKENFAPVTVDCLAVVSQIHLQQYDWKASTIPNTPPRPHVTVGYTAQDIETLIPEAVVAGPPMGVDIMSLVAHCIGAIQQMASRLTALEARA